MSGVCSESIHRLRAQQCSASTTEGQHMYSRVSVHASHFTSQQVLLMKIAETRTCALLFCCPDPLLSPGRRAISNSTHTLMLNFSLKVSFYQNCLQGDNTTIIILVCVLAAGPAMMCCSCCLCLCF